MGVPCSISRYLIGLQTMKIFRWKKKNRSILAHSWKRSSNVPSKLFLVIMFLVRMSSLVHGERIPSLVHQYPYTKEESFLAENCLRMLKMKIVIHLNFKEDFSTKSISLHKWSWSLGSSLLTNVVSNESDSLYHLITHNETKILLICGTRDPLGQVFVKPIEQEILFKPLLTNALSVLITIRDSAVVFTLHKCDPTKKNIRNLMHFLTLPSCRVIRIDIHFCCEQANSEINRKEFWVTQCTGEALPKPRFHVETALGIYVFSDGEFWPRFWMSIVGLSGLDSQRIQSKSLYITTINFTGLDAEFWWSFFMSVFAWTPSEFNWRACISQQNILLDSGWKFWSRFCPFFMLRPLEKFTVCQYIFCYHKNRLQTIKKETQLHQSSQHSPIFNYY